MPSLPKHSLPKDSFMQAETVVEWKQHFAVALRKSTEDITVFRGELSVQIELDQLIAVLTRLKDLTGGAFTQLSDITAVDYPERTPRFDLIYQLLSVTLNQRIRLIVPIAEDSVAPSVTALFGCADWAEREIWDMFGIFFNDHGDLRRLLTDYGFEGHPLRKDFPLTGTVEVRYDDSERRVVYEPVQLTQEYRDFDYESPWEGAQTSMRQIDPSMIAHEPSSDEEQND